MIARAAVGFAAAVMVAEAGRRAGGLTQRGALAAVLVGTAAMAAGLAWGATLVVFFVAGTALSRLGAATKAQRTRAVLGTSGARDAGQVLANGGVFAGCALVWAQLDAPWVAAAALGALCGAFGDTAATEIGTWLGGAPRSIVTGRRVAPGMSGGVTLAGSVAAVVACLLFAALAAALLRLPGVGTAAFVGGLAGVAADSLLGATVQERWHCAGCNAVTERRVHDCGRATRRSDGLPGVTNDVVNAAASVTAAVVAAVAMHLAEAA